MSNTAKTISFRADAEKYRTVQLSYVNLVGSYLAAASQLSFAVGRAVIP